MSLNILRARREELGLSLSAMAARAGLSKSALSKMENGLQKPSWHSLPLLAGAYELEYEQILGPPVEIEG